MRLKRARRSSGSLTAFFGGGFFGVEVPPRSRVHQSMGAAAHLGLSREKTRSSWSANAALDSRRPIQCQGRLHAGSCPRGLHSSASTSALLLPSRLNLPPCPSPSAHKVTSPAAFAPTEGDHLVRFLPLIEDDHDAERLPGSPANSIWHLSCRADRAAQLEHSTRKLYTYRGSMSDSQ